MNMKLPNIKICLISIYLFLQISQNAVSQNAPFASFNSSNGSYIDFGRGLDLNCFSDLSSGNKITITMWVRWSDKSAAGVGDWANLVTLADSTGSGDNGVFWVQHNQTNTKFEFAINTTSRDYIQSSVTPLNNVWYHLALVYDGNLASNNMKLYVNGVQDASRNKTGNIRSFPSQTRLNFGRWPNPGNSYRRFNGKMDEVSVWKKALSATEIQNIMNNAESVTGSAYDAVGLLGFWNFDNNTADDLGSCRNNGYIGSGVVLPVNLVSFSGAADEKGVKINWMTSSEINNSHFLVQHSTDGMDFTTIEKVAGAGSSNQTISYSCVDENPSSETNYYRLIQVDFDGQTTISEMIAVDFTSLTSIHLQTYPNPVKQGENIHVEIKNAKGVYFVSLINASGKMMYNKTNQEPLFELPTQNLFPGMYFIHITVAGETICKKIIIND
ncbi:MAG: hypothetical protein CVU05_05270 [Bacteroidetes bacterium HGW-Bacteroidetes-21]|jgi:hypothetical protein|nr:MAG: hypothetical protein CVU05_05270 [Bacteroidetes bacterium HGW-Bacteroidetes-21]